MKTFMVITRCSRLSLPKDANPDHECNSHLLNEVSSIFRQTGQLYSVSSRNNPELSERELECVLGLIMQGMRIQRLRLPKYQHGNTVKLK